MNDVPPQSAPQMQNAADKRSQLRRAKGGALALLAVAVLVLIAARLYPEPSFTAALIRAAAEAAIVGGLADWFAVTALFRRPLGLPIPHTALIPARKDEIGRSLGSFVSEQFLAPDLLIARLRQRNRALQVATWLASPTVADFVGQRVVALVPLALSGTNDAELRQFFARIAHEGLRRVDLVSTVDAVIDALVKGGKHMVLADAVIELLKPVLATLQEPLIARIGERTGRFFPRTFDRKIGKELVEGVGVWLDAAHTPGTEEREKLEAWLTERISSVRGAPDYNDLLARLQAGLVNHPALQQSLGAIWDELKSELLADAARPQPKMVALSAQLVRTVGDLLQDSEPVQGHVNAAIESILVSSIAPWRQNIGTYIADIVAGWDGKAVAEIIELQVGRDLQYIRVNGTVVGALIGSALFLLGDTLPKLWAFVPR